MDRDDRLCGISICRYQDGHLSAMDRLEHDAPSGLVRTWHYEFDHNGDSPFPRK